MQSFCLRHDRFKQFSRNKCLFVLATADLNSLQGTKPGDYGTGLRIQDNKLLNCDGNKFFG